MGTKDGSIIATIITIHMPRNDAAAALLVRKAKQIAIGAEIIEKSLFVSHDLRLLGLSNELDHVACSAIPCLSMNG